MATKKSQSKAPANKPEPVSSNNDSSNFWKWLYVAGILVASITNALGFHNDILTIVLALIGLAVGLFYFDSADLMNFGLRYLIVSAAATSLSVLPVVGSFITGFFVGFANFLGPVVLGMVIMYFWNKYFGNM